MSFALSSAATSPADAQIASAPPAPDDRKYRLLGVLVVVVVFGGFGGWSALAPLSSAALAPGVITVENYRKTVQHLEGGIVKSIDVRDGELVTKGQVLVTLESTQPSAQLEGFRGQYLSAAAREARLIAERDGLARVRYPDELLRRTADQRALEAMRIQNQAFEARRRVREGQIALYQHQAEELTQKAEGLRTQELSTRHLVASYGGELEDYRTLYKEGFAQKQKLREIERNVAQSMGQHAELKSSIAAADVQIAETKLKIMQLGKEFQREVAAELSDAQTELFGLREKLGLLNDTVARTVVRAPASGMVIGLTVHTVGAVLPAGGRLLDIVPQHESLVVEAKVSPTDVDRVKVGQTAEIRFNAFSNRSTAKVAGTLVALSADRLTDETRTVYYLARVQITADAVNRLVAQKLELLPGMPADVLISTGQRTFLEYLFGPVRETMARSFIED